MTERERLSTGVPGLDDLLGGGLLPGTLTVVVGPTGIGKTQLGLQFAAAGASQEGRRGILFDMSCRGDSQSHSQYAERMFGWKLEEVDPSVRPELAGFFSPERTFGDYLHVFDAHGRRVTRRDLGWDQWQLWQAELMKKLSAAIAFFYGNFTRGARRAVVDGIEPVDRATDSIQLELFEYIYHQILRKDPEWVARDLFREHYRENAEAASGHTYDPGQIGCLLLYTTHEPLLEELMEKHLEEGDLLANANTVIVMGKIREGNRMARALHIAKHRGSYCSDDILRYAIDDHGLRIAGSA